MDDSNENFLQYINSFDFEDTEILNNNSFGLTKPKNLLIQTFLKPRTTLLKVLDKSFLRLKTNFPLFT